MSAGSESFHGWSLAMAAIGLAQMLAWLVAGAHAPAAWLAGAHALWAVAGFGWLFVRMRGHRRGADRVTGARVLMCVALFASLALEPAAAWWKLGLALAILVLDGVDGALARRSGPTRAGAIFDAESDGFYFTTICGACHLWLGLGAWIFVIAALRPLYVLAWAVLQRFRPMQSPNRKGSQRARIIFLCTTIALLADLAPGLPLALKDAITGVAVVLLCYSFGVDTIASFRPPPADARLQGGEGSR